jgi:hypothetical protein
METGVALPDFIGKIVKSCTKRNCILAPIQDYIDHRILPKHKEKPFQNMEHVMSANKLMPRIIAPDSLEGCWHLN